MTDDIREILIALDALDHYRRMTNTGTATQAFAALDRLEAQIKALEAEVTTPILVSVNRLADSLADEHAKNARLEAQIAETPKDTWKDAAMRLGELLATVGPDGYYAMTPDEWYAWAETKALTITAQNKALWEVLYPNESDALDNYCAASDILRVLRWQEALNALCDLFIFVPRAALPKEE